MAIAFQNTAQGYQTGLDDEIASAQQTHTAGRLLVVMISAWENATGAVTAVNDLAGNTFVKATNSDYIATDDGYVEIWYAKNITGYVNNVVTADFNGDHTYRQIIVHEYSGAHLTDPLDQVGDNTGTGTSFTTPASTLNHNDELIVAGYATYNTATATAGAGFTLRNDLTYAQSEDRIQGAKGSYGSALTYSASTDWGGVHATFRRAPETKTWDGGGGDNNFTTGANWNNDVAPNESDNLSFGGSTRLTPNNDYAAGTEWGDIAFNPGASAFTVGGNAFDLDGAIYNLDNDKQTINCNITLSSGDNYMNTTSGSIELGGVISGSGNLRMGGNNNLRLLGTNTFTGQLKAFQGRVVGIANTQAFGLGQIVVNGGEVRVKHNGTGDDGTIVFSNNVLINSGQTGTIDVQNNGSNTGNTVQFPFINHGKSTMNYTGANGYKVKFLDYSLRGGGAGGTATINPTTAPLITGTFNQVASVNHTALLTGNNSDNEIQGVISESGGGSLQITKTGTGKYKFGLDGTPPTNTYTGDTTITAGNITIEPLTVTPLGIGGTVIMNGGILWVDRATIPNDMTVSSAAGKLVLENGFGSEYSGDILLNATLTIESWYQPTNDQLVSGDISGTGGITINLGSANSDIRFTGNNTYSGATTVNDVRLIADSTTALSSSSAFNLKDSAKTELYINGYVCTIGSLTGGGASGGNVWLDGNQVSRLKIGNDNTDTTYEGVIDDGGSGAEGGIEKIGTGKLTLTGNNLYWWNTQVTDGTLIINGSQYDNDEINVAAGATIGGSGTIKGDLNIANNATLSPGDASAAVLSVAAVGGHSLDLLPTSIINFTLGTSSDRVDVIGTGGGSDLQLDGLLNVTAGAGFAPGVYRLFNYNNVLTDNGLTVNTIPDGYKAVVDTSTAGQVNLVVTFDKPVNLVGNLDGGLKGDFQ